MLGVACALEPPLVIDAHQCRGPDCVHGHPCIDIPPTAPPHTSWAHRQVLKAEVVQGLLLRPVHAVCQLRGDAVKVLEEGAKQDLLPSRFQQGELRKVEGWWGFGNSGRSTPLGCHPSPR